MNHFTIRKIRGFEITLHRVIPTFTLRNSSIKQTESMKRSKGACGAPPVSLCTVRLFDWRGRQPWEGPDVFQRPWHLYPAPRKAENEINSLVDLFEWRLCKSFATSVFQQRPKFNRKPFVLNLGFASPTWHSLPSWHPKLKFNRMPWSLNMRFLNDTPNLIGTLLY